MEFRYRTGTRINLDPQIAGEELMRIRDEHGKVEATLVVEEARPKESPLHPAFEWRDKIAGEQWRLWQARSLIRSVHVVSNQNPEEPPAQAFVHIPKTAEESGYYQSVELAAQNIDEAALALKELKGKVDAAIKSFEDFQRRYQGQGRRVTTQMRKAKTALGAAKAEVAKIAA